MIEKITATLFLNISRGLFVAHKILFSFLICTSINRNSLKINELLWSTLLRGSGVVNRGNQPENPSPSNISVLGWDLAYYLQIIVPEKFPLLCESIVNDINAWEDYAQSNEPQSEPLPDHWNEDLDYFEKLLILKIFRPEKLMFAFTEYVKEELGRMYIEN